MLVAHGTHLFREGLALLLAKEPAMTVVAATGAGDAAVSAARQLRPDVVLLGGPEAARGGGHTCRRILSDAPGVKILLLTDPQFGRGADRPMSAGAVGAIPDSLEGRELALVIAAIHRGEPPQSPGYIEFSARPRTRRAAGPDGHRLTEQETRVLARLADGARNEEIARALGISRDTVKAHLKHIFRKLNVRSRTEAAVFGLRGGLTAGADIEPAVTRPAPPAGVTRRDV